MSCSCRKCFGGLCGGHSHLFFPLGEAPPCVPVWVLGTVVARPAASHLACTQRLPQLPEGSFCPLCPPQFAASWGQEEKEQRGAWLQWVSAFVLLSSQDAPDLSPPSDAFLPDLAPPPFPQCYSQQKPAGTPGRPLGKPSQTETLALTARSLASKACRAPLGLRG